MALPVAETLKIILGNAWRQPLRGSRSTMRRARLSDLFRSLQAAPPPPDPHAIEDDIWALWIDHDDSVLAARMQQAIAALAGRDFPAAEAQLDGLVAVAPDWAEAWNKRATLYYLTRRDGEGISDIRRTLELEPRHFGAICGFGQICLRHGEVAAAAEAFAAALAINPHLESVRAVLAQLAPDRPLRLN